MSPTPLFHAVVWIDHHHAQVLQFDAEHVQAQKVKSHSHPTRQHASAVRESMGFSVKWPMRWPASARCW